MKKNVKTVDQDIARCCNEEDTRYALGTVLLTPKVDTPTQSYVTATDCAQITVTVCEGTVSEETMIPTLTHVEHKLEGRYPKTNKVIPEIKNRKYRRVCIDAGLLARMARVIAQDGHLILFVSADPKAPIPVLAEHGIGVLMPIDPTWLEFTCTATAFNDQVANYIESREKAATTETP